MTIEELKSHVSAAGRYFIDNLHRALYFRRWFNIQTLFDDYHTDRVLQTINFYNDELDKWLKSGMTNDGYREVCHLYYCVLEGMLDILRDIKYFDLYKFGDFDPFVDYCWCCWHLREQINFEEYEQIRAFFEDQEED